MYQRLHVSDLKAHDLITSPAFIVIKAASEFKDKTTAINQLWQTDFTYLKDHGLGLVLSQHDPGRLQPLHHLMETLYEHENPRRDGHAGLGFGSIRLRSGSRRPQTASAQRQRVQLRLWGSGGMAARQRHEALARCAVSSRKPKARSSGGIKP